MRLKAEKQKAHGAEKFDEPHDRLFDRSGKNPHRGLQNVLSHFSSQFVKYVSDRENLNYQALLDGC